ncbi:chemotaxis protein CheW [Alteromonas pelagimontana]|uniref:Chemotaxis protein CheW n=1 Tax=Alteromonas pelagimontana TaxID=1858656 RepID=A0A6M4MIF2_9ALTE|nr:chemotaxis protein CheW [Alteromonas pelagimontana]QJR81876.1 chemotaxis protein CheW [Alteromonas pelagimontana]
MTKSTPFAREDVMQAYLDSLLQAPEDPAEVTAKTAKLLEQAALEILDAPSAASDPEDSDIYLEGALDEPPATEAEGIPEENASNVVLQPIKDQLDNRFQALFFEVAGLTMAVPLTTLGGIHRLEKVSPLIGKPAWFKGVMLHRAQKMNVVDTALWVMPEKYDQKLAETLHYQYLITLGDSLWGLASDKLVNTVTLTKDEVKWREAKGKRPWLAGMVKERMCALIDVYQLISMLNNGLGSNEKMP